MKSWKNRRNTYWILVATVFGLVFPSNHVGYYKNLIGLFLCWGLYWYCYICNNREVENQEQKEKEEYQKQIELELIKKEQEIEREKQKEQSYYELVECPKIINYIMNKYNRDWEKDLYPCDAKYHINDIKRKIKSNIEFEKREIHNYKNAIKVLEDIKRKTKSQSRQTELDNKINIYQTIINNCQKRINNISQKYNSQIIFYQDKIDLYKKQCKENERKADDLLFNSPEEIIKAIDCYLNKIEKIKKELIKNGNYDNEQQWIKQEEEKLLYLYQAKLDAINRIKTKKENTGDN